MAKILVVDDHPTNRDLLVTILGYGGYELLEASDGAEALQIVKTEKPDLVITDILMPTMDGYEFVRRLREDVSVSKTKVIFYTATYREREAEALIRQCGVEEMILKPCEPQEILTTVAKVLNSESNRGSQADPAKFREDHLRVVTNKLSEKSDALERNNLKLTALVTMGLELSKEHDPLLLLDKYNRVAREIIGAQFSSVGILGGSGKSMDYFVICGLTNEAAAKMKKDTVVQGAIGELLKDLQPRAIENPSGDPVTLGFPNTCPPIYSFLGVPIATQANVHGFLCLLNKVGFDGFDADDLRLLGMLASQLSLAYENAELLREAIQKNDALRESEARFRRIVDSNMLGMVFMDLSGRLTEANEAFLQLVGCTREAVESGWINLSSIAAPEYSGWAENVLTELARIGKFEQYEMELIRRDGIRVPVLMGGTMAENSKNEAIVYFHDMTEIRKAQAALDLSEESLRQSQKMEAVGRLAGGIAHDFNNLLTVIIGYSDLALKKVGTDSPLRANLEEIINASTCAASLTRQLLIFSRKEITQPKILQLNEVVENLNKILHRVIGEDIELITSLEPDLPNIKIDPGQIEQIVMNLAVNARDAMPGGGKLFFETAKVYLDENFTTLGRELKPGHYVMLAATDNGCGFDTEVGKKIFDPFFTTKELGKGTGLGLSTVYGIVKQAGGAIWFLSEPGLGTAFKIYFPPDHELAAQEFKISQGRLDGYFLGYTILLVEDDQHVRGIACQLLEILGFEVLEANSGELGISIAMDNHARLDVLLTDVVMPGMRGYDMVRQIRAFLPGLKVLFMSGYAEKGIVQQEVTDEKTEFVQKPFTLETLGHKLLLLLGNSPYKKPF